MAYVALSYFILLTIIRYRNSRQIDLSVFILLLYGVSCALSVVMLHFSLWSKPYTPSVEATIVFLLLFSLCLYPISKFSDVLQQDILPIKDDRKLKLIAWAALVWFIVMIALSYNTILMVLNGDMMELRNIIYSGDSLGSGRLPGPLNTLYTIANLCFGCPWIFVFLAFYSRFVQRMQFKYFVIFMLVSLAGPLQGVLWVDRSRTAYWIISLAACFLFFKRYMDQREKKLSLNFILLLVITGSAYLSMVTESRFGGNSGVGGLSGSLTGLIEYLGQPFLNFCYFYDEFEAPYSTLAIIFPSFYKFILGNDLIGGTVLQAEFDRLTSFSTAVFYTYLGHIMVFAGKFAVIAFSISYNFIFSVIFRKSNSALPSLSKLFAFFAMSSIVVFGLFGHYYSAYTITFSVVFFTFLTKYWISK